jgi:hypothetical protein
MARGKVVGRGVGMIYFIHDDTASAIKIGYSTNVPERLATLQTASATKLVLLGTMPGSIHDEQRLHRKFHRLHGEWFRITPELLHFIQEHTTPPSLPAPVTYIQSDPPPSRPRPQPVAAPPPPTRKTLMQTPQPTPQTRTRPTGGAMVYHFSYAVLLVTIAFVAWHALKAVLIPTFNAVFPPLAVTEPQVAATLTLIVIWATSYKERNDVEVVEVRGRLLRQALEKPPA